MHPSDTLEKPEGFLEPPADGGPTSERFAQETIEDSTTTHENLRRVLTELTPPLFAGVLAED